MDANTLIDMARNTLYPRKLTKDASSGGVAAALLSESGEIYTGVCIDTACSMGFCAEHAAAAALISARETGKILQMVAVNWDGNVLPPCGRCREFIVELHPENKDCMVYVSEDNAVPMCELLPFHWRD